jgi:hypothetical protein
MPVRRLLALAAVAGVLAAAPAWSEDATSYLSGVEDLPLMPGLAEIGGTTTVFDANSGRIVEAYAAGRVEREQVVEFYARTLPALGWRLEDGSRYRRDDETLQIDFLGGGDPLTVRFTLNPE